MKILIVRVGAMGDVLHALPAVTALRRARPDWTIDWVIDPRWAPLLVNSQEAGPIVNRIHRAETKLWSKAPLSGKTLRSILDLRGRLRRERYDLVVDMQGTLRSAVIGWMAAGGSVAGYQDPRESLARLFYTHRLRRRHAHVVEQGAALVGEACQVELVAATVDLPRDTVAEDWAEHAVLARPLLLLAPGGGWGAKRWPTERFGQVAQEMRSSFQDCMVNASSENDPLAATVVDNSEGTARMVPCDVAQLIALMRRVDRFVGGDSGPAHLAAALAVPMVALFGPTDPARNGPWGPGEKIVLRDAASTTSHKRTSSVDPGLERITVPSVVESLRRLI